MARIHVLTLLVFGSVIPFPTSAQSPAAITSPTKPAVIEAAKDGFPLHTDMTVYGNVTAQAVLMPANIAKRVFGGEVAKNYAVIALTISNKSPDAALIVQGAFIDYSQWALNGSVVSDIECNPGQADTSKYKVCAAMNQVASQEYRVVRGELLNAQNWTWRNTTVRLLTLLGSAAAGYSFAVSDLAAVQGIGVFNGVVVPGFSSFWPDETVQQLNRISDFGFQTNKLIPRQGSDIIVCFFPINRFLTESYRSLFVKNPAVFFSPFEALVDKQVLKQLFNLVPVGVIPSDKAGRDAAMRKLSDELPCFLHSLQIGSENASANHQTGMAGVVDAYCASHPLDPYDATLFDFISRISLNRVRVVIDGVMSVETTAMAPKIDSVEFEGDQKDRSAICATDGGGQANSGAELNGAQHAGEPQKGKPPGNGEDAEPAKDAIVEKKGTIKGSYLTGGVLKAGTSEGIAIEVTGLSEGSDDQTLTFSLRVSKDIANTRQLTFTVEKKGKDVNGGQITLKSTPYVYEVRCTAMMQPVQPKPVVDQGAAAEAAGKNVGVAGQSETQNPPRPQQPKNPKK